MKTKSSKVLYHVYLFLFGVIYYWISPLITLQMNLVDGLPGVDLLDSYNYIRHLRSYSIVIIFLTLSFILGAVLPLSYFRNRRKHLSRRFINPRDIGFLSIPFLLIGQFAIFKSRSVLFKGYTEGYDMEILGAIATSNCILLVLYLTILIQSYCRKKRINKRVNIYFIIAILELSVVLLGLGSRMYVMIPTIAFLIFYLQRYKINHKILCLVLLGIILFLCVGVWRLSANGLNSKVLVYIGVAEPLFTWISAVSFFEYNNISIISVPNTFFSSFINFVPTVLFPDKADYIFSLSCKYDAPLGATSLITSLLSDFGLIGSMIILFLAGYILTVILFNWRSYFGEAYYCCLCGIIPFQLFRDSFSIINKMVWFNFLILPIVIIGIIGLTIKIQKSKLHFTKNKANKVD